MLDAPVHAPNLDSLLRTLNASLASLEKIASRVQLLEGKVFTPAPTHVPTTEPSLAPTPAPTRLPTATPTASPTAFPSQSPTESPTAAPTHVPTAAPTCPGFASRTQLI